MADRAVFVAVPGTQGRVFDLLLNGRIAEYDLDAEEMAEALRRRRVAPGTQVLIRDESGERPL